MYIYRYVGGNLDTCPYLSVHCLDEAIDSSVPDSLLVIFFTSLFVKKFLTEEVNFGPFVWLILGLNSEPVIVV